MSVNVCSDVSLAAESKRKENLSKFDKLLNIHIYSIEGIKNVS